MVDQPDPSRGAAAARFTVVEAARGSIYHIWKDCGFSEGNGVPSFNAMADAVLVDIQNLRKLTSRGDPGLEFELHFVNATALETLYGLWTFCGFADSLTRVSNTWAKEQDILGYIHLLQDLALRTRPAGNPSV